jgi:predicted nucleic acid-binding protein
VVGLIDTSVFVGVGTRDLDFGALPEQVAISVVTLAELRLGVLMADDITVRQRRMSSWQLASQLEPLPIDPAVGDEWARIVAELRQEGRRAPVNDIWIAATAIRHSMTVITQDTDYEAISGLDVVRI